MHDPDRELGLRLGVAAVFAIGLLVPFALLAVLVVGDWPPLHELDRSVTDALHRFAIGHPAWVRAMDWWCIVFSPTGTRLAAAALALWLWFGRHAPRLAWWVVITMATGGILGDLLKLLVGRHRPDLLEPVARAAGYAFPSGHALDSALGAGVFLLVLAPFVRGHPRRRAALWTAAIAVPLITGVCRVGLGVHWTSDVVGGWLLAVAVLAATTAGYKAWRRLPAGRAPASPRRAWSRR